MNLLLDIYPVCFRNKLTGATFNRSNKLSADDTPRYEINPNSTATYHISEFENNECLEPIFTSNKMNNNEHKAYINKHTENGLTLFNEVLLLEDKINELEKLKKVLLSKYLKSHHILNEGNRIELIWPNGITETIDIHTPGASQIMHERNEYDIVYGYRSPNKDGSKAKIGTLRKLWQGQLFINGYKKILTQSSK